jgi:hypothetical protein
MRNGGHVNYNEVRPNSKFGWMMPRDYARALP